VGLRVSVTHDFGFLSSCPFSSFESERFFNTLHPLQDVTMPRRAARLPRGACQLD
jgi:hypothetical protein